MGDDPYAHLRGRRLADVDDITWFSSEPLGHFSALGVVSSGPIAIVAGFSLASAVAAASLTSLELLDVLAIVSFTAAAVVLFVSLVWTVEANAIFTTPSDRLAWYPEARISEAVLDELRRRQRRDFATYYAIRHRILTGYPIGVALALIALAMLLLARVGGSGATTGSTGSAAGNALLWAGAVGLALVAAYVVTFAPVAALRGLQAMRDERLEARGLGLLKWPTIDPSGRAELGKLAILDHLPSQPPPPHPARGDEPT